MSLSRDDERSEALLSESLVLMRDLTAWNRSEASSEVGRESIKFVEPSFLSWLLSSVRFLEVMNSTKFSAYFVVEPLLKIADDTLHH